MTHSGFGQFHSSRNPARQRGLLVLDALVFAGFIFGLLGIANYVMTEVRLHSAAVEAGRFVSQVAQAVRIKIANEGVGAVLATPETDTDWLKNTIDCPGVGTSAGMTYLAVCGFPDKDLNFGMPVMTDIQLNGAVVEATITLGPMPAPYDDRHDLLQTIRRVINQGDPTQSNYIAQTFINVDIPDPASPTDTVIVRVGNSATNDVYIRRDGQAAWDAGVTQDVNTANFSNVGDLDGTGDVQMARFLDNDDPTYLVDPADTTTRLNGATITDLTVENDMLLNFLSAPDYMSNHIIWDKGVVDQGGTVAIHSCPNGSPEIHGSVSAIVATDNLTYPSPKNLKGFNLFAETVSVPGSWRLWAKAIIDDESASPKHELIPPSGATWVRISYWTTCG